jgi:hypothetical protein
VQPRSWALFITYVVLAKKKGKKLQEWKKNKKF